MPADPPQASPNTGREKRSAANREPHLPIPILHALYRISSLGTNGKQPRDALEAILQAVMEVLPAAASGSVSLVAADSGQLEIEVESGLTAAGGGGDRALKPGEGITGWVALHGKALRVPDTSADPRYREARPGIRSEIAAPLMDNGQVIGVLNLDSEKTNAFSESDLRTFELLTAEAARAIRNLWQIRQLTAKAAHLESVLSIGQSLVSRLDLADILNSIARQTRSLISCPVCAILLLDTTGTKLECRAISGSLPAPLPDLPLIETSASVAIVRRKQIEVLHLLKTEENLPLLRMARENNLSSLLFTPVLTDENVAGVIAVFTGKPHRFSNEEKSLVGAMANLGSVALTNARLYARILQSEENLRRGEKLTALGLLAAEVAHEIRNPLTVIKLLFQSLGLDFPKSDPRAEDRRIIDEKLDHLESIVSRVLSFARTSTDIRSRLPLTDIIADTLALVRLKAAQSGIRIEFHPPDKELSVKGNKGQLQQVLLNLLLNSLHAMERGGCLTITARDETREGVPGGCFEVADTGPGIPKNIRDRVFESFLTERADGAGLGLGIARQIVDTHHGTIQIVDTGSTGTRIKVWIPGFTSRD